MEVSLFLRSAERFDPVTGWWEALPDMTVTQASVVAAIHAGHSKYSGEQDILLDLEKMWANLSIHGLPRWWFNVPLAVLDLPSDGRDGA